MKQVAAMTSRPRDIRINRRSALGLLVGSGAAAVWAQGKTPDRTVKHLAIGNYGMKTLSLEEAIRAISGIGFDGFELCAIPEWDSTPTKMGVERRKTVGSLLTETGLRLVAVMENVPPSADEKQHQFGRERLKGALMLARDLVPDQKPMVQTVLGGGKWDEVKSMYVDRVGDWAKLAKELDTTICIKPHRFGAMSTPEQAAWLIQQLGDTKRIRIVYDYSHYAFRDLTVDATTQQARGLVAYVAMKDAFQTGDKVSFALPGDTKSVDHAAILKALRAAGYDGDFCCEVSSQLSAHAGYDPVQAAQTCYRNMAPLFTA
jgi:sugar phosphate isomerase/epimerase